MNVERTEWAVVGATGFVGRAVAARLRAAGHQVREVPTPRLRAEPTLSAAGIARRAEAEAGSALTAALAGARVIVIAGGLATPDAAESDVLTGANALVPATILRAAAAAGVSRVIHLSSAAVLGHAPELSADEPTFPFSPYSRSKALGEAALLETLDRLGHSAPRLTIVRATSVQGPGRPTTLALQRVARSRLASVASPGTQPSAVSSIDGLVDLIHSAGVLPDPPTIALQPWEGASAASVLHAAGGRPPIVLPAILCRIVVALGEGVGRLGSARARGLTRRLEMMWFGQRQPATWPDYDESPCPDRLHELLAAPSERESATR
ncbi:NAD-dependent epimerase/dehydratase family protein [Frondihabitans australicus]|uniref:NAD-dependent epimerase/dehydratase family protein n=1 Tax=Frondihabitans australicus TaxID=386892 RepID=A0A495ILI2_9MICO|nr:NAD-dependent epimerase/dehydratase family protein [Frondihabitans australicus]RKR76131.1 NAD-dependent epimerase/dehydratase family protein [Frondihabitans australicus]